MNKNNASDMLFLAYTRLDVGSPERPILLAAYRYSLKYPSWFGDKDCIECLVANGSYKRTLLEAGRHASFAYCPEAKNLFLSVIDIAKKKPYIFSIEGKDSTGENICYDCGDRAPAGLEIHTCFDSYGAP